MLGSYTLNQLAEFHLAVADPNGGEGGGGEAKGAIALSPRPHFLIPCGLNIRNSFVCVRGC